MTGKRACACRWTVPVICCTNTYGVYPEEIDGLKRDYEKLWGEVSKVLRERK